VKNKTILQIAESFKASDPWDAEEVEMDLENIIAVIRKKDTCPDNRAVSNELVIDILTALKECFTEE
jgi:hypothetical protein